MADSKKIIIKADLRPCYYDQFRCLAAECRLSCCEDWRIPFDKKDYLTLKRQSGSPDLEERLAHGVRRVREKTGFYGEFNMSKGPCPLLGADHLCILQKENGHGVLPRVCRSFPRSEAYERSGYFERSLTPACEGVLGLLWDLPEGVGFLSDPLPREKYQAFIPTNPGALTHRFQEIRGACIDLLQDRRTSLPQRILLMGLALRELADGERDIPRWAERTAALPESMDGRVLLAEGKAALAMNLSNNLRMLSSIRGTSPELRELKADLIQGLGVRPDGEGTTIPLTPYETARERYQEQFGERDYFMENLMVSLFFHLRIPSTSGDGELWRSYVNFCNLYSFYRFMAVMSCREGASGGREELFRLLVHASRLLIHNGAHQSALRDELFENDSATLAHMAILLCG